VPRRSTREISIAVSSGSSASSRSNAARRRGVRGQSLVASAASCSRIRASAVGLEILHQSSRRARASSSGRREQDSGQRRRRQRARVEFERRRSDCSSRRRPAVRLRRRDRVEEALNDGSGLGATNPGRPRRPEPLTRVCLDPEGWASPGFASVSTLPARRALAGAGACSSSGVRARQAAHAARSRRSPGRARALDDLGVEIASLTSTTVTSQPMR